MHIYVIEIRGEQYVGITVWKFKYEKKKWVMDAGVFRPALSICGYLCAFWREGGSCGGRSYTNRNGGSGWNHRQSV